MRLKFDEQNTAVHWLGSVISECASADYTVVDV